MPCTYEESPFEKAENNKRERKRIIAPYKTKLNKVTRLLCAVMTAIENHKRLCVIASVADNAELQEWWAKHQASDRKRNEKNN